MMHHVRPRSDTAFNPNLHLEITPDFMRLVVERIHRAGYEIVSLDAAVDLLKTGYGLKRYAVLTFDDGYRDNLEVAYPVLKEYGVPFTIFLASGLIDRKSELWWKALERIIADVDELALTEEARQRGEAIPCATPLEKEACFNRLARYLTHEVSETEQRAIIRAMAERHGLDLSVLADECMMSWDDIRELAKDPLVTLGAHTYNHYALARLSAEEARADVVAGVERIEAELGRRPKHFAFPYGYESAVNARDAAMLKDMGFFSAVTTMPGILKSSNARDCMTLPRVSLNGKFQDGFVVDQYLTGAPFALYGVAQWLKHRVGFRHRTADPSSASRK